MPLHLSPELLAIIISFLPKSCLPLLSTVSRTWQAAIERHTMSAIHLKSTDLAAFATVFCQGHRRLALAQLHYDAILPSYNDHQCARFETDRDKRLNNEALTAAIHDLFSLLHSWEHEAALAAAVGRPGPPASTTITRGKRGATARLISLTLNAYSLSDVLYREGVDVEEQRVDADITGSRKDLFECRYEHSFLRLLRADELHPISRISTFGNSEDLCYQRRIEGASLAGMGAKMPNLETVAWWVHDDEKRYPEVRRMHRFEFAQSLSTLPPHSLRSLTLHLFNNWPWNQNFPLPSVLLPSSPRTDHLSLALHNLSQSPNFAHLILSGDIVLSPSIFWPSSEQEEEEWIGKNKNDNNGSSISNHPASSLNTSSPSPSPTPFWPHLQTMHITLSITSPTGDWLYILDPLSTPPSPPGTPYPIPSPSSTHSSDSDNSLIPDEYDYGLEEHLNGNIPYSVYRTMAHRQKIDEWMLAMGKAVGHMPAIDDLKWEVNNHCLSGIEVNFLASEKRWLVIVGGEARWEVSPKIRRVLEDVGVGVRLEIEEY